MRSKPKYNNSIHVRLSPVEMNFINMISEKTGLNKSESVRLIVNMLRLILGFDAINYRRLRGELTKRIIKIREKLMREGVALEPEEILGEILLPELEEAEEGT